MSHTPTPQIDVTDIKAEALRVLLAAGSTTYEKRMAGFVLDLIVHHEALVDALRNSITESGATAERSHEFAMMRLAAITTVAREALKAAGVEL